MCIVGSSTTLTVQSTPTITTGSGNQQIVTYTFSPPLGKWRVADAGAWSVVVVANEVGDHMKLPLFVAAGIVGKLKVRRKLPACVVNGV
jgi:hypothetical protein